MYKIIIYGSMNYKDYDDFKARLNPLLRKACNINDKFILYDDVIVYTGNERGTCSMVKKYCEENNIKHKEFPVDWEGRGLGAGSMRNKEMARKADCLIAFYDGGKATYNMIRRANIEGLKIYTEYLPKSVFRDGEQFIQLSLDLEDYKVKKRGEN